MNHTQKDIQQLKEFYSKAIKDFKPTEPGFVRWASYVNVQIRYKVLYEIGKLQRSSILDVGCGHGEFYKYLASRVEEYDYIGIDIMEEYINLASKSYENAKFICEDFMQFDFQKKFDYVFACGTLNSKLENHQEKHFAMIKKMYELSKKGVGFNLLIKGMHPDDNEHATYSISEVEEFIETFVKKYKIITGYLDYDFTVYLYKK